MRRGESGLDPRTWLIWAGAASLPPLAGRNPFPLLAVLLAVLGVRAAWHGHEVQGRQWHGVARLAAVFALVATVFNALTVRAGTTELFRLPQWLPFLSGPVTLNAVVYGLLSGLALLNLVLTGALLGSVVDWPAALRLVPDRLLTVAVAGSIAIAYVPQTIAAFRDIREAQMARGYRPRGVRDAAPLLVPLLHGGLERAVTLAEALESRAFGAPRDVRGHLPAWRASATIVGITAGLTGGYLLATGRIESAAAAVGVAAVSLVLSVGASGRAAHRTRYRPLRLRRSDLAGIGGAIVAGGSTIAVMIFDPGALRYEPYPQLRLPTVQVWYLLSQAALVIPAFLVPVSEPENTLVTADAADVRGAR